MPGPSEGCHCERERLFCTNTVKGLPLRTLTMPDKRQPPRIAPAAAPAAAPRPG